MSVSKCGGMHLGNRNRRAEYKLLGQRILETKEEKDLGEIFSDTFKPATNYAKASKAAIKIVKLIRRNIINKTEGET